MTSPALAGLRELLKTHLSWESWERLATGGRVTVERPRGSHHPVFAEIIYPIDYGSIDGTIGTDRVEVDVFVGTATNGLVGLIATDDLRRGDREVKFLLNCSPEEIYLANGFINFDPSLMQGLLVLRRPLATLWKQ